MEKRTILSLDSETGVVELGSPAVKLPGILDSISVNGELLFENAQVQGRSGSVPIVQGWQDAKVDITLLLIDDLGAGKTRFDFLKEITGAFKKADDAGKPVLYEARHPALAAWNMSRLLFSGLKTSETRGKRKISAALSFVEYEPRVAKTQERKATTKKTEEPKAVNPVVPDKTRKGLNKLEERYAQYDASGRRPVY
jgi:hypothetical protein